MIIIDTREPNDIIKSLKAKIKIEEDFIEVGDYLLPNGYAIERKKGRDLMSSVMSNRLFEQLNNLYDFEHPILVIIEDNKWKDFYFSKGRYIHKQYIGMMTTLAAKYPKLKVIQMENDEEFIAFIEGLHKKLTEDGNNERPKPIMRKARSLKTRKENLLCATQGISVTSAKRLLKEYKTIENLCAADIKDIMRIKKISKKQAENVYKILHE